jgi:hypothetical protein
MGSCSRSCRASSGRVAGSVPANAPGVEHLDQAGADAGLHAEGDDGAFQGAAVAVVADF